MKITKEYIFFYKDWLSNYQKTDFYYPSKENPIFRFDSTEQGFMFLKALRFGDFDVASEIYATQGDPGKCRRLGRLVKGYDDKAWSKERYNIFADLIYQKYLQDEELRKKLLSPEFDDKLFVEASPIDKIWGIGMSEDNPRILDQKNWRGLNYLGQITTEVREKLKNIIDQV